MLRTVARIDRLETDTEKGSFESRLFLPDYWKIRFGA